MPQVWMSTLSSPPALEAKGRETFQARLSHCLLQALPSHPGSCSVTLGQPLALSGLLDLHEDWPGSP